MTERLSRVLIASEAVALAAPLTSVLLYMFLMQLSVVIGLASASTPERPTLSWADGAILSLDVAALAAASAGLFLLVTRVKHGREALRIASSYLWILCMLGAAVVIASWLCWFFPPVEDYSPAWQLRTDMQKYIPGTLLLIPLCHLLLEARR